MIHSQPLNHKVPQWILTWLERYEREKGCRIALVHTEGQTMSGPPENYGADLVIYDLSRPPEQGSDVSGGLTRVNYVNWRREPTSGALNYRFPNTGRRYTSYVRGPRRSNEMYISDRVDWPASTVGAKTVWVHTRLADYGYKKDAEAFFQATVINKLDLARDASRWAQNTEDLIKKTDDAFKKYISKKVKKQAKATEDRIVKLQKQRTDAIETVKKTDQKLVTATRELEYQKKMAEGDEGYFINQLKDLKKSPRIKELFFTEDGNLEFVTGPLYLYTPDQSERCYLGEFRILINDLMNVKFYNKTNPKAGRDHPHVQSGSPCLGQAQVTMNQLLAKGEVIGLVNYLFQYLETYNPNDDYGRYAAYWFGESKDNATVEIRQPNGSYIPKYPDRYPDKFKDNKIEGEDKVEETTSSRVQRGEVVS